MFIEVSELSAIVEKGQIMKNKIFLIGIVLIVTISGGIYGMDDKSVPLTIQKQVDDQESSCINPVSQNHNILFESKRVVCRLLTSDDVGDVAKILSDPEVMRYMKNKKPFSYEETKHYIQHYAFDSYKKHGYGLYAVIYKQTNQLIGMTGVKCADDLGESMVTLSGVCDKKLWGKGIGTEVLLAMRDYAFNTLGINRLWSTVYLNNTASKKVQHALGMKLVKTVKYNDLPVDVYCLNKTEKQSSPTKLSGASTSENVTKS